MPEYSAREALLWQLIAKNRKRRLALHTALRTVYQRRQLLLRVACLTVLLLANNNGAAVLSRSCRRFQRNVGWFTNVWSTYSEKRFKETFRISTILDKTVEKIAYLRAFFLNFVADRFFPPPPPPPGSNVVGSSKESRIPKHF